MFKHLCCFSFFLSTSNLDSVTTPCEAEDGTIRFPVKKRSLPERSLTGFDRAHEPEFKKQKLEQLQRKAYHSALLASKSESSGTSHVTLSSLFVFFFYYSILFVRLLVCSCCSSSEVSYHTKADERVEHRSRNSHLCCA